MAKRGIPWWEPSVPNQAVFAEFLGLHMLSERQFDVLHAGEVAIPTGKSMMDVSMSGDFAKLTQPGIGNIVTPNCELYIGHLCRLHHPLEALHLQGIHFGQRHITLGQTTGPIQGRRPSWQCFSLLVRSTNFAC